jgi:hypothetical protein
MEKHSKDLFGFWLPTKPKKHFERIFIARNNANTKHFKKLKKHKVHHIYFYILQYYV